MCLKELPGKRLQGLPPSGVIQVKAPVERLRIAQRLHMRLCLFSLTVHHEHGNRHIAGRRLSRIQLDGQGPVLLCFFQPAQIQEGPGKPVVGLEVARLELDGTAKLAERGQTILLMEVDEPHGGVSLGQVGTQLQRPMGGGFMRGD